MPPAPTTPKPGPLGPGAIGSDLVGRERELASLRARLAEGHRLLTLIGPAGVGKTSLSLGLVRALEEDPGGAGRAFFCDLSEASTADEICAAVVHALDIKGAREGGEALIAHVSEQLARLGPCLLVLDNFEQLVEASAATVGVWMRAAPEARFVATSRVALRLGGECVEAIEPLSVSEAEALFVRRVRLLRPGYAPALEEAGLLRELLEGLDHLPLAIELAAARMQLMSLRELRERLSERLLLLRSRRRDVPARQSSLAAALSWSWQQLTPWERSALRQCAGFRGGFDVAAVTAVLDLSSFGAAPPVLDVVQALVEQSMVRARDLPAPSAGRRLSLLRTIRDFVVAQGGEGEEAGAVEARRARHYVELGEALVARWRDRGEAAAFPHLRLERENLLAAATSEASDPHLALRAALCLHPIVTVWGPFLPQLELLNGLLERAKEAGLEEGEEARALIARGRLEIACLGVPAAERSWSEAVELAQRAGDPELEGRARHGLAASAQTRGHLEEAAREYALALACLRQGRERRALCFALLDQATLRAERGEVSEALRSVEEAATATGGVDDLRGTVLTLRGVLHLDSGALDEAQESFEAALELSREGDYRLLEAQVLGERVVLALLREGAEGEREAIERALSEARPLLMEIGDRRMLCALSGYAAVAHHLFGEVAAAAPLYERTRREAEELGCARLAGYLRAWSAMAQAERSHLEVAEGRIEQAAALPEEEDPFVVVALELARAQGELARARAAFAEGLREPAETHLRAARARASASKRERVGGRPLEESSRDLRLTRMLFERALRSTASLLGSVELAGEARPLLTVDGAGRWFRFGDGAALRTGRRRAVRRLLRSLCRAHLEAPGSPLSRERLVAEIWEGERMSEASAKNRLHVALSQLRKLGLREQILTEEGGYLLHPGIDLRLVEEE